jgi:thioesterase III
LKTNTEIKVRGYHLDAYLHVNNARYLEFLEEARWDYLDKINALDHIKNQGLAFVIVKISIDYLWPAKQGENLRIETHLAEVGNTSFVFHQTVHNTSANRPSAEAKITFVLLNMTSGKAVRVDDQTRALLSGQTN